MRYVELERRIRALAVAAPDLARRQFAADTIHLLAQAAEEPIARELTSDDRTLLDASLTAVERGSADDLEATFPLLCASILADEARTDELSTVIDMLLLAIDYWKAYARDGDPRHIAAIAVAAVNSVDSAIGGDTPSYSTDNMLGDTRMAAEWERQQRSLSIAEPGAPTDRPRD